MQIKIILTGLVAFICGTAMAQDNSTASMPDPEYMNQVYYYPVTGNKLGALEKGQVTLKTKAKLGGFGGSSSAYVMDGSRSAIRVHGNDGVVFVIKMQEMAMMDPSNAIVLYKFETKGDNRQVVLQQVGFMGKGGTQNQKGIKLNMKKSATGGIYTFVPDMALAPGEYGFINMMSPTANGTNVSYSVFAFGVDG